MSKPVWQSPALRIMTQIMILLACILAVGFLTDLSSLWTQLRTVSPVSLVMVMGVQFVIITFMASRWHLLIHACGAKIGWFSALRLTLSATVMNLILPTSVGGDVVRVGAGRLEGVSLSKGGAAAILDRVIGMVVLMLLVGLALLIVRPMLAVSLAIVGTGGLWLAIRLGLDLKQYLPRTDLITRLADALKLALTHPTAALAASGLSLTAHLGSVAVAVILAWGMGVSLGPVSAFMTFPVVILAGVIPVSVGGWGLRELAAIPAMALVGLSAEAAAAIAALFALTQLVTALVGTGVMTVTVRQS